MEFNIELLPKIIYKYRNFENEFHRRIITHQEIYFAKISEFLPAYDLIYSLDRDYIKNEDNRREYYKVKLKLDNANDPIIDNYIKENIITEKLLDESEAKSREHYERTFGIFSASETYKNENLWKIFADNKKGFCVGFDFIKTFPLNQGFKGPVKYVKNEDLPKDKLLNNNDFDEFKNYFFNLVFKLPEIYSEEQEYRLAETVKFQEDRIKIVQKNLIKVIIIGEKMSKTNQEEIIKLIKKHLPNTTIKKLKYSTSSLKEIIVE